MQVVEMTFRPPYDVRSALNSKTNFQSRGSIPIIIIIMIPIIIIIINIISSRSSSVKDGQTYPKRFLPELNKTQ